MSEGAARSDRRLRPAAGAEASLLAAVRDGGGAFERVVFTRNRRVMVSVGDRGRALRINECFRDAPEAVLRALGEMYGARRAADRVRARSAVQAFVQTRPPEAAGRHAPRRRRAAPGDAERLERLAREFERVNAEHFGGLLPRVPIALSGRMRRRNGHFSSRPLEIVISRRLFTHAVDGEAEQTLRHEMIHLWQHETGEKLGHGPDFRRWARRLDVHPRATRVVARAAPVEDDARFAALPRNAGLD